MKEWFEMIGTLVFFSSAAIVAFMVVLLLFALTFITVPTVIEDYLHKRKKRR